MSITVHNRYYIQGWLPEISGKTLNGKINFSGGVEGVPVDGQRVVGELLDVAHQAQAVLGVHVDDSLFDLQRGDSTGYREENTIKYGAV